MIEAIEPAEAVKIRAGNSVEHVEIFQQSRQRVPTLNVRCGQCGAAVWRPQR